jgi:hypothetical protein
MQGITQGIFELTTKSYADNDIISLAELKKRIFRMDSTLATIITDTEIENYRATAIQKIEKLINSSVVKSDYILYLPTYANTDMQILTQSSGLVIEKCFVRSLETIHYLLNNVYTLLTNSYELTIKQQRSCVAFFDTLPTHDVYNYNSLKQKTIKISFKAGIFNTISDISGTIQEAVVSYVITKYQGCENEQAIMQLKQDINEYCYISSNTWYQDV